MNQFSASYPKQATLFAREPKTNTSKGKDRLDLTNIKTLCETHHLGKLCNILSWFPFAPADAISSNSGDEQ